VYVYTHIHKEVCIELKQMTLAPRQETLDKYPKDRATYPQDWPAYNKAKTSEKYLFLELARELLNEVYPEEKREKRVGRPKLSFKEMLFCAMVREYCGFSSRKTVSELKLAKDAHMITRVPHFNSICNFLQDRTLYPEIQKLIVVSALPLKAVEYHVAIDSTGFSASSYQSWMEAKYGKGAKGKGWMKAHIACGVKTQIIVAAEITDKRHNDSRMFGSLFQVYSKFFEFKELSADRAYSSKWNLQVAMDKEIFPYIPFKKNTNIYLSENRPAWNMIYKYFKNNEAMFMKHYHQRSKVETAFSMVKKRLGPSIKAKSEVSQKNELLCRFLVHNITVLIQEMNELEIQVDFFRSSREAAQKCG
jgi:transposase